MCVRGGLCTYPQADCDGDGFCEVNLSSNPNHCGLCGRACNATSGTPTCAGGVCTAIACSGPVGNCDGDLRNGCEADLFNSVNHCGGCGNRCVIPNAVALCAGGGCVLSSCLSGFGNCDGNPNNGCEVSLANDNLNCGACGRNCYTGALCVAGTCRCPAGQVACSYACINPLTDNNHCGGCGNVCPSGTRCANSVCTPTCAPSTTDCSTVRAGCVNTMTSISHCGGCGMACSGFGGTPSCMGGMCAITCSPGFDNCDGNAANGCEALNTATHCGRCAVACIPSAVPNSTTVSCTSGSCRPITCAAGFRRSADMGRCEAICGGGGEAVCPTGSPCLPGFTPNPAMPTRCTPCGGNLQPACSSGSACRAGLIACASASGGLTFNVCYDPVLSPLHCGACNNRCAADARCVAGACQFNPCPVGQVRCAGVCVNSDFSDAHCGACGAACTGSLRCLMATCSPVRTMCTAAADAESRGACISPAPETPRGCTASDLSAPRPSRVDIFDAVGADQPWAVPEGVTEVLVKLWGAGGGTTGAVASGAGGGGAFAMARFSVTPGEVLTVVVGQGGRSFSASYGGGGGRTSGASGGGRSAVRQRGVDVVTAGAGGGGGNCISGYACGNGGAGGVARGEDGTPSINSDGTYGLPGTGGTMTCGGNGGFSIGCGCGITGGDGAGGRALQGGSASSRANGGGSGGGGWMGGGASGGDCVGSSGAGGGGGSSYVPPAQGCALAGVGTVPGNNDDADRGRDVGVGGSPQRSSQGGSGRVLIYY